jgi:hypothetical protein
MMIENSADLTGAPLPTKKTLSQRKNLPLQIWRFFALNIRMVKMIMKGTH